MPRRELPEDAKQITKYGKHELAGLYYSPSDRCFYNSYKVVRKVNIDGRNGFYTRQKSDGEKIRTLYISIAKLMKEYAELVDIIDWTKPEKKPRQSKKKAAETEAEASPAKEEDEIKMEISDEEKPAEPEPKKSKKSNKHGADASLRGIDYDSAFKAMRNATAE